MERLIGNLFLSAVRPEEAATIAVVIVGILALIGTQASSRRHIRVRSVASISPLVVACLQYMLLFAIAISLSRILAPAEQSALPFQRSVPSYLLWLTVVAFPPFIAIAASYRMKGRVTGLTILVSLAALLPTITIWDNFIQLDNNTNAYLHSMDPTLKAASMQSQATMVGSLVALITAIIAGLSILYSVFSLIEQRQQADAQREETRQKELQDKQQADALNEENRRAELLQRQQAEERHQENFNKELLQSFNNNETVDNGKIILESMSRDSVYLPVLHLKLYHDPGAVSNTGLAAKAKLDAARLYYPNDGHAAYNPSGQARSDAAETKILTEGEVVEIVPTVADLVSALTPDSRHSKLTLLGNKICYAFDAFLEMYVSVGKLHIAHLKKMAMRTDEIPYLHDIDIWWDAIDLPYWSRLLLWGTVEALSESEETGFTVKDTLVLDERTPCAVVEQWCVGGELLDHWQKVRLAYTRTDPQETGREQSGNGGPVRNMIREYMMKYYPEALQIAFVLATSYYDTEEQDAIRDWIRKGPTIGSDYGPE